MHLSGFDVLLLVTVPLAVTLIALATWRIAMSRYRRALRAHRLRLVDSPPPAPVAVETAQPAPAPLTAGGSSESALVFTP